MKKQMTEMHRTALVFISLALAALAGQSWAGGRYDIDINAQQQMQNQSQQQSVVGLESGAVNVEQANGDNSLSVNTKHRRNAPAIFAPSINPSHPCALSWSIGGSATGGGGLAGRSYAQHGCEIRETARIFAQMGHVDIAVAMLCQTQAVKGYRNGNEKEAGIGPDQCLQLAQLQSTPAKPPEVVVNVEAPDCGLGEKLKRCEDVSK